MALQEIKDRNKKIMIEILLFFISYLHAGPKARE
jgi:hypothetical protein